MGLTRNASESSQHAEYFRYILQIFFLPIKWILTFTSHTSKQVCIIHPAQQCVVTKLKYGCQCACVNTEWVMLVYNAHKWTLAIALYHMNCNHKSKALFWMVMDYNKHRGYAGPTKRTAEAVAAFLSLCSSYTAERSWCVDLFLLSISPDF
jgi:hypothetical protein